MSTGLFHQGHFYGFNMKLLRCIDANTGDIKWTERGLGQGSLIAVGVTMVIMSETGELMSAHLSPDAFTPGPKTRITDFQKVWSCPIIADGNLYAKSPMGELICIDVKRKP